MDEEKVWLIEKINQSDLLSKKHKKICKVFNYIDQQFLLVVFLPSSTFSLLIGIANVTEFCRRIKNLCNNYRN